jgi:hypothetical protein
MRRDSVHFSIGQVDREREEDQMFGFILGAVAGAAGYWAYQRYVVGSDDDAFADFETSSIDRSTTSETSGSSADSPPSYSDSSTGSTGSNPSA